jgi:hypothetical protein
VGCLALLTLLPPWRNNRRLYLLIFVTAMGIASLWIVRDAIVFRQFILVQTTGYGSSLFAGTIETQMYGDEDWTKVLNELTSGEDNTQNEVAADRRNILRALERIESNPAQYLRARLRQYPRLFLTSGDYLLGSGNITFKEALHERNALVIIVKVSFILGNIAIFLLAIYAIFLERRRFVLLSHIILFPIFVCLVHLPMWIESRYSLPMMPLVLILTARGIEGLWDLRKSRLNATSSSPPQLQTMRPPGVV